MNHFKETFTIDEEKIKIGDIPCLRLIPEGREGWLPTVILYHGLASNKENQRMRGYPLAMVGYQVIIPDALHHGEREAKEMDDMEEVARYFWQAVLQSVEEAEGLIDELIENYRMDRSNVFLTGHSMGGFISAGIMAKDPRIKSSIPINGSFNWVGFNDMLRDSFPDEGNEIELTEEVDIGRLDPMNNMEKLLGRDILILHGEKDMTVNIKNQREFYDSIKKKDRIGNIRMEEYEDVGHFVTTNMLEDMIIYLKEIEG